MVYESKLRIVRNGGSNMIDTGQLYASSPLCSTWFNRFSWLKYGFLIYLIVCVLYFNTCMPTGWSRVRVPKGWASWLMTRLITWWCSPKGTLFISRVVEQTLFYFPNCPYWSARLLTYCVAWLVAGKSAHFDKSMLGRIPLRHGTRGFLLRQNCKN